MKNEKRVIIEQVIFDNLASLVDSKNVKQAIENPYVLYGLVMSQAPFVKTSADHLSDELKKFSVDHKILIGDHLVNVEHQVPAKAKLKVETQA